jgi:hypothetical protein
MTVSVNSETHNRILEIETSIGLAVLQLGNLDAPPTRNMLRAATRNLKHYAKALDAILIETQPESLRGCKCALPGYEDHAGKCSGANCYCH